MRTGSITRMASTYGGEGILFHATTDAGQDIGIHVDQETILQLADYCRIAGHIGHGLWHIQNPQSQFPCGMCQQRAG